MGVSMSITTSITMYILFVVLEIPRLWTVQVQCAVYSVLETLHQPSTFTNVLCHKHMHIIRHAPHPEVSVHPAV